MSEEAQQENPVVVPKGTPLKRRAIAKMHAAAQELARRYAPSMDADLKFGRIVVFLDPHATPQIGERARIAARIVQEAGGPTACDLMKPVAQQVVQQMITSRQEEYDDQIVYLEIPEKLFVSQNDLPQQKAGDNGWENAASRGALAADLGVLFKWPD